MGSRAGLGPGFANGSCHPGAAMPVAWSENVKFNWDAGTGCKGMKRSPACRTAAGSVTSKPM
jgi:hypothetical protein